MKSKTTTKTKSNRKKPRNFEIGWRETVALPQLGVAAIRAKIDTGARTSALCTSHHVLFEKDGEAWIRFGVTGLPRLQECTARLIDRRAIKNTSGQSEDRYVIRTIMVLGQARWPIEISLADRRSMTFDMILGRTAIRDHAILVNPGRSYLAGKPTAHLSIVK